MWGPHEHAVGRPSQLPEAGVLARDLKEEKEGR
jgi:hypothetical protein